MPASYKKLRRCLIRHRLSLVWFADGHWVSNPHDANDFSDLDDIFQACAIYQLRDVEVVFRGTTDDLDVAIPLRSTEKQGVERELAGSETSNRPRAEK